MKKHLVEWTLQERSQLKDITHANRMAAQPNKRLARVDLQVVNLRAVDLRYPDICDLHGMPSAALGAVAKHGFSDGPRSTRGQ